MKTQRTHLLALRAASQVTAITRAFRKIATGTAASAMIVSTAAGCTTDSDPGFVADTAMSEDVMNVRGDVSALMDTILLADSASQSDVTGSDGGGETDDVVLSEDTSTTDAGEPDDTRVPTDVEQADTSGGLDGTDGRVPADVGSWDDAVDSGDMDDIDEVVADASMGDAEVLPESCLIPNGKVCDTNEECNEADMWGAECVDQECHESDQTSEAAMECCGKQYAAGNFGVPGCNPWGPPAPPLDRGYRLAELSGRLEVA